MEYFNLTTPQKNIWNLQKYYEDTAIANICGAVFYQEMRDIELLKNAINQVIKKQSALRLKFTEVDGEAKQYVKEYSYVYIKVHHFPDDAEFETYARQVGKRAIGLLECDMFYFEIVAVGEKLGILAVLSHLVSDAWTFSLIINEIDKAYWNLLQGNHDALDYTDYIDYIRAENDYFNSPKYEKDDAYWQDKYALKPENSSIKSGFVKKDSIRANRLERKMTVDLTKRISAYCADSMVTPAVLFETALNIYLFKINPDNQMVTIGVPVLNRTKASEKKTAGMFISTVPLTMELSQEDTARQVTAKITCEHMQLFRHQKYPYSMILRKLREKQDFQGNLYDVMFSFQNTQTNTDTITRWYSNGYSEVPFTLHVDNRDGNDTYTMTIDYQVELFRGDKEVNAIIDRLEHVLEQILDNDGITIKELSILPEKEKERILYQFNDTAVDYSRDKCVHELFMKQAQTTPDAIAVIFEEKKITYRELDEMSNGLAHLLRDKGVGRGDIVPIIAKRSWHIIVAMLGILKAGAAYMPIAMYTPKDRVQFIIEEAKSKVACVLGDGEVLEGIEMLKLDELEYVENKKREAVENLNSPGDLCYVIFTSGSTGGPKGVMITHFNLVSYLLNVFNTYRILSFDASLVTDTNVDLSVTTIFCPLLSGGTLEIVDMELMDALRYIMKRRNGFYKLTPTHIDMINSLKIEVAKDSVFIIGGEALRESNIDIICNKSRLIDEYGPTETTVGCCVNVYENNVYCKPITIGRPIANTQIYILDKHGNPVPIGVPGELCIAGDGVGLGYLNRPDLTVERFVPNPFATEENGHGKTIYHTGDLAAWRENGEIEYLGRIDTQVKIRGLRIELGEIESVMSEFPGIRLCAVTDKKDEEGRQYLVGYYTTASDEKEEQNIMTVVKINEKELRQHLMSKLPKYMVPNYFMHLSKMPMTPSGKTDRKNLPVPEIKNEELSEYVEPTTEQEAMLCKIMGEVLDYKPFGIMQDFFSYGGDSLRAIEFVVRAEDKGMKLKLQDIFDYPTVAELVGSLQREEAEKQRMSEKEDTSERFKKYESVLALNNVSEYYDVTETPIKSVLLSGITGFLGAHIADALLQNEDCVIYCLVRTKEPNDRRGRLPQILEHYFGNKYNDMIGIRIIPVVGDITNEHLSNELPETVDMVIHAAATVKHYGSYDYFYKVNTLGTKHMAEYALRVGARFIHISTISVSGNSLADSFDTEVALEERYFGENCLYQEQPITNVYVRSKFEAECVVLDAMLQGLQANIIRVGNLTNRSRDYVFQPNYTENAFLSRIKAALELRCLPDYMMPIYSEFSPVDDTADAIVRITKHFNNEYTVFHVYSNKNLYFDRMVKILKELSIDMEIVDGETFVKRLKETVSQKKAHIYEAFLNDMDGDGKLNYETNIHIQNDFTCSYLKQLGFEWTEIDFDYVKGYIEYFQKLQYFERGIKYEE